jgi:hypothetical protein
MKKKKCLGCYITEDKLIEQFAAILTRWIKDNRKEIVLEEK